MGRQSATRRPIGPVEQWRLGSRACERRARQWTERFDATTNGPEKNDVRFNPARRHKAENDTAEIEISADGKFLYDSNRGHNSIAIFSVDSVTGAHRFLEAVPTGGKTPRNFTLDPTGNYLFAANQDSNNIVIFKVDKQTGHLMPTGQTLEAASPVCMRFVATN